MRSNRIGYSVRAQVYRNFRTVRPHFSVKFSISSPVIVRYRRIEPKFGLLNFSDVRYIYFLKMWLVWKYGEYNKSYERGSRKCHLKVLSIFFFIWNRRMMCRMNRCRFLPSASQEQFPAACLPSMHCHTACQIAGMPSAMLRGARQMTSLTQLFHRPSQMARNNWAKMTSRSRKTFPVRISKQKESKSHTSLLQDLDCCPAIEPTRRFWATF